MTYLYMWPWVFHILRVYDFYKTFLYLGVFCLVYNVSAWSWFILFIGLKHEIFNTLSTCLIFRLDALCSVCILSWWVAGLILAANDRNMTFTAGVSDSLHMNLYLDNLHRFLYLRLAYILYCIHVLRMNQFYQDDKYGKNYV